MHRASILPIELQPQPNKLDFSKQNLTIKNNPDRNTAWGDE